MCLYFSNVTFQEAVAKLGSRSQSLWIPRDKAKYVFPKLIESKHWFFLVKQHGKSGGCWFGKDFIGESLEGTFSGHRFSPILLPIVEIQGDRYYLSNPGKITLLFFFVIANIKFHVTILFFYVNFSESDYREPD